jgi:hypothetical protein
LNMAFSGHWLAARRQCKPPPRDGLSQCRA